jgi:hypothetical protein
MDYELIRNNERMKATAGLLFNLAGGIAAATAARLYTTLAIDFAVVTWTLGGIVLIIAGWKVLEFLEPER